MLSCPFAHCPKKWVWEGIKSVFVTIGSWIDSNIIQPVSGFFTGLWDGFLNGACAAWEGVKNVFSQVGQFFTSTFEEAWAGIVGVFSVAGDIFVSIKDGIVTAFKTVVNGLITGLNEVVSIPFEGINAALRAIKNIDIAGVKPFSGLKTITVPQIPYLAQGAVLPPNKPFMAVVGDQKHGTNIEAPLATIQEAFRVEVGNMIGGMMAGFDTSVNVQRQILEAILGIEIGDTTIGEAAARYNTQLKVIRGG